ncbi:MAG: FHA domain-containing protein [Deltaproteobacteria bacterium]|nr:FHA domain-containing protein [Deltaproteobacteria bacterium]
MKTLIQHKGRHYPLKDEVIVIGRDYNCDIRIDEPAVSRVHALICREKGNLVIEDLGRKSGTRVNRVAIRRKILSNGDRIQIGRTSLVFRYNKEGQSCPA